jgi:hypothetical protein
MRRRNHRDTETQRREEERQAGKKAEDESASLLPLCLLLSSLCLCVSVVPPVFVNVARR